MHNHNLCFERTFILKKKMTNFSCSRFCFHCTAVIVYKVGCFPALGVGTHHGSGVMVRKEKCTKLFYVT